MHKPRLVEMNRCGFTSDQLGLPSFSADLGNFTWLQIVHISPFQGRFVLILLTPSEGTKGSSAKSFPGQFWPFISGLA